MTQLVTLCIVIANWLLSFSQRVFEAPPSSPALFEYIDNFPSRRSEKEKERKSPAICSKNSQQPEAENSLLR